MVEYINLLSRVSRFVLHLIAAMTKFAKMDTRSADSKKRVASRISATPDIIADFCERWHITQMSLFGSVLRDDFGSDSDIDVLIEFEPDCVPGLRFVGMAEELERLLGRPVDVLTRSAVEQSSNFIRRKEILGSAQVIYEAK